MHKNKSQKLPHHDLVLVKRLACQENCEHIIAQNNAIIPVSINLSITYARAKEYILKKISNLNNGDFSEKLLIDGNTYDVYGKEIDEVRWYIKLSLLKDKKGEFIYCISFHPLKKNMTTNSGTIKKF